MYGQADGDGVTVLCLAPSPDDPDPGALAAVASGLEMAMREFDLLLVDWCGGQLLDATGVSRWLTAGAH